MPTRTLLVKRAPGSSPAGSPAKSEPDAPVEEAPVASPPASAPVQAPPTAKAETPEVDRSKPRRDPRGNFLNYTVLGDPALFQRSLEAKNPGMRSTVPVVKAKKQTDSKEPMKWLDEEEEEAPTEAELEYQAKVEKERTLRESLQHIAETKKNMRKERVEKLKSMHVFERIDEIRERKALDRHAHWANEWSKFKTRFGKRFGKDVNDLVMSRAEEYRTLCEEKDLMFKAIPIEVRQGGNVWQMSLRDAWTRYVGVGNLFSGLEIPFIDRPELRPDKVETVGVPMRNIENKKRKALADSLMTSNFMKEKKQENNAVLEELRPHRPEVETLAVVGEGMESVMKSQLLQVCEELRDEDDDEEGSVISDGGVSSPDRPVSVTTRISRRSAKSSASKAKQPQGPRLDFASERLLLTAGVKDETKATLPVRNTGTTAVYYTWKKLENQPLTGAWEDEEVRFHLADQKGSLLPGESRNFDFTFKSTFPGTFTEKWELSGFPAVPSTQHVLHLRGVAVSEDLDRVPRSKLELKLAQEEMFHTVAEVIDEVLDHVRTPPPSPKVLVEDPDLDREVFLAQNKTANVYYSGELFKAFKGLAAETFEVLEFLPESRVWDSSLESLRSLIEAVGNPESRAYLMRKYTELIRFGCVPPSSATMFYSIAYELLVEVADGIPDGSLEVRRRLDLPEERPMAAPKKEPEAEPAAPAKGKKAPAAAAPTEEAPAGPVYPDGWDEDDIERAEFAYRDGLNSYIYKELGDVAEKMALLCAEADIRSQIVAHLTGENEKEAAEMAEAAAEAE